MSSKKLSPNKLTDAQLVKTGNEARRLSAKPGRSDSKQALMLATKKTDFRLKMRIARWPARLRRGSHRSSRARHSRLERR